MLKHFIEKTTLFTLDIRQSEREKKNETYFVNSVEISIEESASL